MTDPATLFRNALGLVGLSHREASSFFSGELGRRISPQTVADFARGKSRVPPDVWSLLRGLYARQVAASDATLDLIEEQQPDEITFETDTARAHEWPSADTLGRVHAAIWLSLDPPST